MINDTDTVNPLDGKVVKVVPWSTKTSVAFDYNGTTVTLSKVYANTFSNCYFIDLSWNNEANNVYGIPLRSGVNVLQQYATPLPNLYVFNTNRLGKDPSNHKNMEMYIINDE